MNSYIRIKSFLRVLFAVFVMSMCGCSTFGLKSTGDWSSSFVDEIDTTISSWGQYFWNSGESEERLDSDESVSAAVSMRDAEGPVVDVSKDSNESLSVVQIAESEYLAPELDIKSVEDIENLPAPSAGIAELEKPVNADLLAKVDLQSDSIVSLGWALEFNIEAESAQRCELTTRTFQIDQEGYTTQVWLNVVGDRLLVNTTTHLDVSRHDVGVVGNSGEFQKFAASEGMQSAFFPDSLTDTLDKNSHLALILSGDELGMRHHMAKIKLSKLKAIYPSYQRCQNQFIANSFR